MHLGNFKPESPRLKLNLTGRITTKFSKQNSQIVTQKTLRVALLHVEIIIIIRRAYPAQMDRGADTYRPVCNTCNQQI